MHYYYSYGGPSHGYYIVTSNYSYQTTSNVSKSFWTMNRIFGFIICLIFLFGFIYMIYKYFDSLTTCKSYKQKQRTEKKAERKRKREERMNNTGNDIWVYRMLAIVQVASLYGALVDKCTMAVAMTPLWIAIGYSLILKLCGAILLTKATTPKIELPVTKVPMWTSTITTTKKPE